MGNNSPDKRENRMTYHPEQHTQDVNNREIFKNNRLASQFLKNYTDIPLFSNLQPEDIEDVTKKYQAFLGVEFETDNVKKVCIHNPDGTEKKEIYVVALIEHKSKVDYDVTMQLFRYMSVIWYEYRSTQNKMRKGSSAGKHFRYPLIIPIVYYEGKDRWTASLQFRDRIDYVEGMEKYIPDFTYKVVSLNQYTNEELSKKQDEMSLVMLMNKIQTAQDLEKFRIVPEDVVNTIYGNAPEEIREIYVRIIWSLLMKMKVPNEEAEEIVEKVRGGQGMGYLFENMDEMDIQAERRNTRREKERADAAEERADAEKERADTEKERADAAEQELERLRQEISRLKSESRNKQ